MLSNMLTHCSLYLLLTALTASAAFQFTSSPSNPTSCDKLSVTWNGGSAPFYLHLIPVFGVPRNISIPSSAFQDNKGSFDVNQLPFSKDQQFVLSMSDSSGMASGGVSQLMKAGPSTSNAACDTNNPAVDFSFQLNSQLQQCATYTFSAFNRASQPATITGLIPGGQPVVLSPNAGSQSYDWKVNVKQGTQMIFMMSDSQGRQGGSSQLYTVNNGDASCINNQSPSSTPAPSPQPTSGSGSNNNKGSNGGNGKNEHTSAAVPSASAGSASGSTKSSNGGAIAGGVIGSLAAIGILGGLIFLYVRRRNTRPGWPKGSPLSDPPFAPQYGQYKPPYSPGTPPTATSASPFNQHNLSASANPFADPPVPTHRPGQPEYTMPQIHPYAQSTSLSRNASSQASTPSQIPSPTRVPVPSLQPVRAPAQPPAQSPFSQQVYPASYHTPHTSQGSLAPPHPAVVPSQRKAFEAASEHTASPQKVMYHKDVADVDEVPPTYQDRRSYAESRSSLAYAQDSFDDDVSR